MSRATDDLASGVRRGDRAAVSRAITLVESSKPEHRVLARELLSGLDSARPTEGPARPTEGPGRRALPSIRVGMEETHAFPSARVAAACEAAIASAAAEASFASTHCTPRRRMALASFR